MESSEPYASEMTVLFLASKPPLDSSASAAKRIRRIFTLGVDGGSVSHLVKQDVGGLEVPVDHRRVRVVEEGEAPGRADGDLHPPRPWHGAVETCTHAVSTTLRQTKAILNKYD